ncbi:MAG: DAK2 domain-containing protein [Chloroflexi bacterium]|nr:DAK2 domain-containing protein [Chloroflexota bacterium]
MQALNGKQLAEALTAGFNCLQRYRDPINALNVYPVPDGDTGTNMMLTMRAGVEKLVQTENATAGEVAAQMADGTFWEARGNSGVILSQFFKGIAQGLEGEAECGGRELAQAFRSATDAAYKSVGNPVEGTMLTVIRYVAEALESDLETSGDTDDILSLWQKGYQASRDALDATPSMLAKLREAGVVDAGGMGIVVILGGAYLQLTGEDVEEADLELATAAGQIDPSQLASVSIESDFLDSSVESEWGYCTQFLIQGEGLDIERVRSDLAEKAESLVIIGDDRFIRVHVHMEDPGVALTYAVGLGELDQIKIDNMSLQNQDWASGHQERGEAKSGIALVAVAPGDGLAQLFKDTAGAQVVSGGQTMNPSVAQLTGAAERSGAEDVILLPNNKNVAITATQAAERENESQNLHVVATSTVSQGVAAALAFNAQASAEQNLQAMQEAVDGVVSIEVTRSVRDTTLGGITVAEGDFMALVDGDLTVVETSAEAALLSSLEGVGLDDDHIVTIYWGSDTDQETSEGLVSAIEEKAPGIQVDLFYGGQPHYPYFASVE